MNRATAATRLLSCALLVGASIGFAARAEADPADNYVHQVADTICNHLDADPAISTVEQLGRMIVLDTGWTYERAGEILATSVLIYCPDNWTVLERFAATYASARTLT